MKELRPALLTAAGLSDKAKGHLTDEDKTKAISGLIRDTSHISERCQGAAWGGLTADGLQP